LGRSLIIIVIIVVSAEWITRTELTLVQIGDLSDIAVWD